MPSVAHASCSGLQWWPLRRGKQRPHAAARSCWQLRLGSPRCLSMARIGAVPWHQKALRLPHDASAAARMCWLLHRSSPRRRSPMLAATGWHSWKLGRGMQPPLHAPRSAWCAELGRMHAHRRAVGSRHEDARPPVTLPAVAVTHVARLSSNHDHVNTALPILAVSDAQRLQYPCPHLLLLHQRDLASSAPSLQWLSSVHVNCLADVYR